MMWSAVPAWLIGLAAYGLAGLGYGRGGVSSETVNLITDTLRREFLNRNPWLNLLLLLPMAIVFFFAVAKKPTIPAMLLSSAVAAVLAFILQKMPLTEFASAVNTGFKAHTGVDMVDKLLSRGGMMSMMETQLVAFTAFSFGGIMQKTGMLSVILDRVMKVADRVWSLVFVTIGSCVMTALVTGSSYLSVIIPGDLLSPVYKKKDLAAKNLSRIIDECGGIIVPLVPWSMAGVYIQGALGVDVLSYVPWAIGNYAAIVILGLYGATKFTMAPKIREDETQAGS
jgi:Na+:H+ antiporter, NhaC family